MSPIVLHLLRHARPVPPQGINADVPLSVRGRDDAAALVPSLQSLEIRRIVCSPHRRAIETVRPFATYADIRIEIDARLRERDMPVAAGPEEHIERVRTSFADPDYAPPGGETFRTTSARARECLQQRLDQTPAGLLLVGHGQCLTLLLRGVADGAGFAFWSSLPTPALIELSVDEPRGSFRLLDWRDKALDPQER